MRSNFEEFKTNKYACRNCNKKDMIPNEEDGYVKGWKCKICGEINYPSLGVEENSEKSKYNLSEEVK